MDETELVKQVFAVSPWLAAVVGAVVLLRKEITNFLAAGRNETAMEALMAKMVGLFEQNLTYFNSVSHGLELIIRNSDDLLEVQRKIYDEMLRTGKRGG